MTLKKLHEGPFGAWGLNQLMPYLQNHAKHLKESEWNSLPELTHHNGGYNHQSCQAQAWSIGTILQAILL